MEKIGKILKWICTETGEAEVAVNLKWEQAAVKIADLIDEENYLNDEEREEYDTLVRFREERSSAKSAILMVTHDPFTASCCRRVVFLRDGQIFTQLHRE